MNEQLSVFGSVSDSKNVSLTDSVSERKHQAIQRFLDKGQKENDVCIGTYSPGKRKTEYFRLSYRVGKKVKHIHIPGGSTRANLARFRVKKLQQLIDRGAEVAEIKSMLADFRSSKL